MSRCLTRSIWIDGIHVPLTRYPVTLTDGTPLRVRAGKGVHVRDLTGPVTVQVHTPVGVHTTTLDPALAFGRAGRRVSTPLTSAPQVYLAVQAALEDPTPAVLAQIAGADANWVRAMISNEDGIVDDLAEQDPARRAAALQVIAAHPDLRDTPEAAALVVQEVTRWSLPRPSALLLYALGEGSDVELLARLASANSDWDSEALPLSHAWVPERARERLHQVWRAHASTISPSARVRTLHLLRSPRTVRPTDLLNLPEVARDLILEAGHGDAGTLKIARSAFLQAATAEDVLVAAMAPVMSALVEFVSYPEPLAALDATDTTSLVAALESSGLPAADVEARRAWVTARLGRTYDEVDAVRRDAVARDENSSMWRAASGERFAAAVLANPHLSPADRFRFLEQVRTDELTDNFYGPFDIYPSVLLQMVHSGDTQAAYRLLMTRHRDTEREGIPEKLAEAWRHWSQPQQGKALRQRAETLLPHLDSPADLERVRAAAASMDDLPPALGVIAATTAEQVLDCVQAAEPLQRWEVLPALACHPDLDAQDKARVLTSPAMTEAAGESFTEDPALTRWGYGSELFSRRIDQAVRELSQPKVYGTSTVRQMPPALVWLAAYTLTQDKDHVDTALSLAQDWHDSPAALAAAVDSLLRT